MYHEPAQFELKQKGDEYREGLIDLFPEEQFEHGEVLSIRSQVPVRHANHLTIRISKALDEQLIAIADRYNMPKSEIVRRLLSKSVEEFPGQFVEYRLPLEQAVSPKPRG